MDFQAYLNANEIEATLDNYKIYLAGQVNIRLEEQGYHQGQRPDFTLEQRDIIAKRLSQVANTARERYGLEPTLNNPEQDTFVIDSLVRIIGEAILIDNRDHDSIDLKDLMRRSI